MTSNTAQRKLRLAIVCGKDPSIDEIRQYVAITDHYSISLLATASVVDRLLRFSWFPELAFTSLPEHEQKDDFIPGLERTIADFDIVVVKERTSLYAYQVVKAKWRYRFRLIIHSDNLLAFPGEHDQRLSTVRNEITNAADGIFVATEAVRQALLLEGVPAPKIHKISPYVSPVLTRSTDLRLRAFEFLGLAEGNIVISHIGNIEWSDGLEHLIIALKSAGSDDDFMRRQLRVVICGCGIQATRLQRLALQLHVDQSVKFVTYNEESMAMVLAATDCLFYTSMATEIYMKGNPYPLVSAMAYGIPVLTSRNQVVEETLGKHRLDYCSTSYRGLAHALRRIPTSKGLLHDIVAKNKTKIQQAFTRERSHEQLTASLKSVVNHEIDLTARAFEKQIAEVECRVQSKQYLAAIDLIEAIFAQSDLPNHHRSNLYRLVGDCFIKLGDLESGKNAYINAIELDRFSFRAHIGLGTIGLTKENHEIAVIHFQKAVTLAPNDEMANLGLGLAFQGMEELEEANRWVIKALACNAENSAAIYTIVKLAYDRENFSDAESALRNYLDAHPSDIDMLYSLGGLLFKQKRLQESVRIMDRILDVDPNNARALLLKKKATRTLGSSTQLKVGS